MTRSLALNYGFVTLGLSAYFTWLIFQLQRVPSSAIDPRALLPALFALVLLTALVWLAMLLARNVSVAIGKVSMRYYQTYRDDAPPEWIERPARTFMNLLEVPVLFYVACLLMLATGHCDPAHVLLAQAFVALRLVHALVYMGWNHVPARFGTWVAGCITLAVIWVRLGAQLL
jgi:hypothetical protein